MKYENKETNRKHKISFLLINGYFINDRIVYILNNNKDKYINKK